MDTSPFLKVQGENLVNAAGKKVILRGFGLGGWMNMENFITGYSANEEAQRQAIEAVLGSERYRFFFDRFLEYFFTEADAQFVRKLGLNLVRLPINYRHFEDDDRPFEIKQEGFRHLDRVIDLCARAGIYTILDLHAVPGYQNQDWHSDNPTHKALFWVHKHFQDRTANLWEHFAARYKGNPWVAGYNLINEPYDPTEKRIASIYERLLETVRKIDPDHVIFLEGNRYSADFHMFGEPLPNVVYTNHLYALPGFISGTGYPAEYNGAWYDIETLEEQYLERSEYMMRHKIPVWVGEFGPVYTNTADDGWRYRLLREQLMVYNKYEASWAIWTYKDIGLQGVAYAASASPWMQRLAPFLEKKARLGADAWGGREDHIRHIMQPLEELFQREFPNYQPGPFGAQWYIRRMVRHILISEALLPEFAERFRGLDEEQIDLLMQSFKFENCTIRTELANLLAEFA